MSEFNKLMKLARPGDNFNILVGTQEVKATLRILNTNGPRRHADNSRVRTVIKFEDGTSVKAVLRPGVSTEKLKSVIEETAAA